jgi:hypothetical protein
MKQQTATDWLWDQFVNKSRTDYMEMLEEAEEMHKQQVKDGWHDGNMLGRNGWIIEEYDNAEGYYNKTYNQ